MPGYTHDGRRHADSISRLLHASRYMFAVGPPRSEITPVKPGTWSRIVSISRRIDPSLRLWMMRPSCSVIEQNVQPPKQPRWIVTEKPELLPPLPPEMTGITIAARYRSATREASVGGDLYEIIPTGHGIRVIIGDVRGNGLDAVLLARHVLSAFRRSAVAMPAMEQVAGEVGRAIAPHLGEEDFVTAALAQIAPSGELTIVNCGHHPPLLRHRGDLQPLTDGKAALPLGLEDDFTAFTATWSPGDRLLLYTDGLVESRDAHGDFLPEDAIETALLAPDCDQALDTLMRAVDRHTGGHAHDDMALLLLEHGASPRSSANGRHPVPGRCQDASVP